MLYGFKQLSIELFLYLPADTKDELITQKNVN